MGRSLLTFYTVALSQTQFSCNLHTRGQGPIIILFYNVLCDHIQRYLLDGDYFHFYLLGKAQNMCVEVISEVVLSFLRVGYRNTTEVLKACQRGL